MSRLRTSITAAAALALAAGVLAAALPDSSAAAAGSATATGSNLPAPPGGYAFLGDGSRTNNVRIDQGNLGDGPVIVMIEDAPNGSVFPNTSCSRHPNFTGFRGVACFRSGVTSYAVALGGANPSVSGVNSFLLTGSPSIPNSVHRQQCWGSGNPGSLVTSGRVWGTRGNDVIRLGTQCAGTSGANDIVRGAGGNDTIVLRGGNNGVDAGSGSDFIDTVDGSIDTVRCSTGHDIARVDLTDRVSNCEVVERAPVGEFPVAKINARSVRVRSGQAAIRLRCPSGSPVDCRGRLTIQRGTRGTRTAGSTRFQIRKGRADTVRIRVGRVRGVVRAIARDRASDGRPRTITTQLRMR